MQRVIYKQICRSYCAIITTIDLTGRQIKFFSSSLFSIFLFLKQKITGNMEIGHSPFYAISITLLCTNNRLKYYGYFPSQQARASVSCLGTGPKPPETFNEAKRQVSLAIISLAPADLGTIAKFFFPPSSSSQELRYPSKSAFVIKTASPEEGECAAEANRCCLYSWTACLSQTRNVKPWKTK